MLENPFLTTKIPPLDKYHEIELNKLYDGVFATQALRIQMASFFGTANLAMLTLAFSTQKSILFLIAGALIVTFVAIDMKSRRALAVYYYRSLELKNRFAPEDTDVYIGISSGNIEKWINNFPKVLKSGVCINMLSNPPLKAQSFSAFWLALIAAIAEVSAGLFLWLFFSWKLF